MAPKVKVITADEEYKKNPELKKEDIRHLKEWAVKQQHLPTIPDELLILFLHCCNYSLEQAKKTIERYFTVRTHSPELFSDRNPSKPELQKTWNVVDYTILPKKDNNGYKLVLARLQDHDASKLDWNDVIKMDLMAIDSYLREEGTTEGFVFLFDMAGLSLEHIMKLPIGTLKKFFVYVQEALPLKMKAVHVINTNAFIDKLMFLIRPLMDKKLADMLRFHTGVPQEFFKEVPQALLPSDYGGNVGSVAELRDSLKEKVMSHKDWFLEEEKLRVDESKRTGQLVNAGTLFGMEGSFKKLSID